MDENLGGSVEEFEPDRELTQELIRKNRRGYFWRGTLCGAAFVLILCLLIGGVLMFALPKKDAESEEQTKTEAESDDDTQGLVESILGSNDIVTIETKAKLKEIRQMLDELYLYSDEIDEEALQEAIIKGYVAGLNEPYTVYYNEAETKALFEGTSGTFGGIGVGILYDRTSGLMTFTTIYVDCPGEKAGFQEGDILYKVDGEDVSGLDLDSAVSKIRGEVGSDVEITVIRNGEEYTATVTRALIENDTVNYEMKESKLGYIQVTSFEEVTLNQFEEALDALNKKGMKGLVIDLRNNTGGNLDTVCDMLDLILPEGTIVSIKDRNGNGQVFSSDADTKLTVPLVVLVNGYSASASEIFAGAVQDYEIGTLVGTTTYGKGIVQNIFSLGDGTSFKLTCSEYFTPDGRNIHGTGIEPDVKIEYEADESNPEADNQLEKALEILKDGM